MGIFLTDGHAGKEHVRAEHVGYYNVGMFGYETGYFVYGFIGDFETEILTGNKVRVKGGMGILGGRRFTISGPVDVYFENGATGEKRIDVIHLKHTQGTDGVEGIVLEVAKGTPVTSGTPQPREIFSKGPVPDLATDYYRPMFLVEFDGVNIISVEKHKDFRAIPSVMELVSRSANDEYLDGSTKTWNPVLFAKDGNTYKYAGGYAARTAERKIIAGRCYLDINFTINSLGTLTNDLALGIMGASSGDIPKAKSNGLIYSASISYVTGAGENNAKVRASIASGNDYITLFLEGLYLKTKDITKDFQMRLSISYEIANAGGSGSSGSGGTGGSTGGVKSYNELSDLPQINGVTLTGNKTSAGLNIGNPTDTQVEAAVKKWMEANPQNDIFEEFEPVLTVTDGTGEQKAGGYASRTGTKRIIGKRCFIDLYIKLNNLGMIGVGTGEWNVKIKGANIGDIQKSASYGTSYQGHVRVIGGLKSEINTEDIECGMLKNSDVISLYNKGSYLTGADITKDFAFMLSLN